MFRLARRIALVVVVAACVVAVPALAQAAALTAKQQLGKSLFWDANLSEPAGQSCADCHAPSAGFADPDRTYPTSRGVVSGLFGNRNAPPAAYAYLIPPFGTAGGCGGMGGMSGMSGSTYRGGQFWDGRASTLVDQAKGPFLNPLEMNNLSKATVVRDVKASSYAASFRRVYGAASLDNVDTAYDLIAEAIAAYESSPEVSRFTSKYDAYAAGTAKLTAQESQGLALFNGKAGCFRCHGACGMGSGGRMMGSTNRAFSNFTYHNVGTPRNPSNPFYTLPTAFNPAGPAWVDGGLGEVLRDRGVSGWESEFGKHRVQTLRNIAVTGPYMHNGVFTTLKQVVQFYNQRDTGAFGPPEVGSNVTSSVGSLGLTPAEEDALVAFLGTLTDR